MKFRWFFFLVPTLIAVVAHSEPAPTATQKFGDLEALLERAGRFDLKAHVVSHGATEADLTASLGVAAAGIVAMHMRGTLDGKAQDAHLRSDGIVTMLNKGDQSERLPPGRSMRQAVQVGFLRIGLLHNLAALAQGLQPEHDKGGITMWASVARIHYASAKKAGLTGLSFDILIEGKMRGQATLWIDDRSRMPVRREQSIMVDGKKQDSVEDYTDFIVTA
jgi:hypothetical protein